MKLSSPPQLFSQRLKLCIPEPGQADLMVAFRRENRQFLEPWEPRRRPEFFTISFWELQLRAASREFSYGQSVCLAVMDHSETEILGVCNFTNIVRGTFQSCHLGYALAERHQGKGMMEEALRSALDYVFNEADLHRVMANYLPHNERSGKLLHKLGFEIEGKAREYLLINGRWEDHILTSMLQSKWQQLNSEGLASP